MYRLKQLNIIQDSNEHVNKIINMTYYLALKIHFGLQNSMNIFCSGILLAQQSWKFGCQVLGDQFSSLLQEKVTIDF